MCVPRLSSLGCSTWGTPRHCRWSTPRQSFAAGVPVIDAAPDAEEPAAVVTEDQAEDGTAARPAEAALKESEDFSALCHEHDTRAP